MFGYYGRWIFRGSRVSYYLWVSLLLLELSAWNFKVLERWFCFLWRSPWSPFGFSMGAPTKRRTLHSLGWFFCPHIGLWLCFGAHSLLCQRLLFRQCLQLALGHSLSSRWSPLCRRTLTPPHSTLCHDLGARSVSYFVGVRAPTPPTALDTGMASPHWFTVFLMGGAT